MSNYNCLNCNTDIKSNTSTIQCDICQGLLHLKCVGLSDADMKLTRAKSKAIKMVCNVCNNNLSQFKDVKALIATIQKEFSASINTLKAEFEGQLNELRASIASKQEQNTSYSLEEIVSEVTERERRKRNLIIFGAIESSDADNRQESEAHDHDVAQDILKTMVPGYINDSLIIQRLGRRIQGRNRPLKISLRDDREVISFIKNAKKLRSDETYQRISISFDRTPRQIEYYKQLKAQLTTRIGNGERNLTIRHFNGVPRIVNLN